MAEINDCNYQQAMSRPRPGTGRGDCNGLTKYRAQQATFISTIMGTPCCGSSPC